MELKPSDDHWHNRAAWDRLAQQKDRLATPAKDEDFNDPLAGVDGMGWLGGDVRGKRLLCLAAGGGRQGPIYSAAGAIVTVVDLSPAMLMLDREVSEERKLKLRTIEASMDDLSPLKNGEFDIVIHPVSTCYVPDVRPVFREVARVLVPGGIYVSQHKQPSSLQASQTTQNGTYQVQLPYYKKDPLPPTKQPNLIREQGTLEYIHRWEELIGEMCAAGFVIEALTEPFHAKRDANEGSFAHRCSMVPPYVRLKARRSANRDSTVSTLIID